MTMLSLYSGIQGLQAGLVLLQSNRIENSVLAGKNALLGALFQLYQGQKTLTLTQRAFSTSIPLSYRCIVYLGIPLLGALNHQEVQYKQLHVPIHFLQKQIGTICHIAAAISSIVMLYFGYATFGLTSLTILGIALLSRKGILPFEYRKIIHLSSFPLLIGTTILCGSLIDKIYAIATIALLLVDPTSFGKQTQRPTQPITANSLTSQQIGQFQTTPPQWKVNRDYVYDTPALATPDIELSSLLTTYDAISWTSGQLELLRGVLHDESIANPILHIRKELENLIDSISKREILEGEPLDYTTIEHYLKVIAKHLTTETDVDTHIKSLAHLATSGGGGPCGPGKYEAAETLYAPIAEKAPKLSLRQRIFLHLEGKRSLDILNVHRDMLKANIFKDSHSYNIFLSLIMNPLNLRAAAARNDTVSIACPFQRLMIALHYKDEIIERFWERHDPIESAKKILGTPAFPKPDFYAWWRERGIEADQIDEDGEPRDIFIEMMLYEMGILSLR